MQQINITQKISEAATLIDNLKPILKVFGNFEYQILLKGKDDPQIILQIYFINKNVWTSTVLMCVKNMATKKEFYFTLETIEENNKIALNIII
jgi:hypothetical protein